MKQKQAQIQLKRQTWMFTISGESIKDMGLSDAKLKELYAFEVTKATKDRVELSFVKIGNRC